MHALNITKVRRRDTRIMNTWSSPKPAPGRMARSGAEPCGNSDAKTVAKSAAYGQIKARILRMFGLAATERDDPVHAVGNEERALTTCAYSG